MASESDRVETIAKAMCESDGANWDAATFGETADGQDPEEQREYWREKAQIALAAAVPPPSGDSEALETSIRELESLLYFSREAQIGRQPSDAREFERRIGMTLDKLKAAISAPSAGDGWQTVPKEPTEAMIKAATSLKSPCKTYRDIYRKMLRAAPPAKVGA